MTLAPGGVGGTGVGRFDRQERFAGVGPEGQQRLRESSVLLVGVGALGSHLAETLVRAGVGRLWIADRDIVELHNLQRQGLFDEADAEQALPKAVAAKRHLKAIAAMVDVVPLAVHFDATVYQGLGRRPDLILDGTDNFATRYLLNDLAVQDAVPWIHGGVLGAAGNAFVVQPGSSPCFRCRLPEAPPQWELGTCETVGVLAPAVTMVTSFMAMEALKLLCGRQEALAQGVFVCDLWRNRVGMRLRQQKPDPTCLSCGTFELPALKQARVQTTTLCGSDTVQVMPGSLAGLDLVRLATHLKELVNDLQAGPHLVRFMVEGVRFSVFPGGRALVFGAGSPERARSLYDRYLGIA